MLLYSLAGNLANGYTSKQTTLTTTFNLGIYGGSLAQLVEHRAFNPMVIGSNPIRPIHLQPITGHN